MSELVRAAAPAAAEEEKKAVAAVTVVAKGKEKAEVTPTVEASSVGDRGRFVAYPSRVAEHTDVVADAARFRAALEGLHTHMGTRLKVPIIGGKDLDLHQLYKEVTSRGGIDKVKAENRWREVTASFIFPATATNASFMLKKYYMSLLYHFEQLYFFRVQGWHQQEIDSRMNSSIEIKTEGQAYHKRKRGINTSSDPASSSDNVDVDVIVDGKFEHGYIVTVIMGSKSTKAILYNCTEEPALPTPEPPVANNSTGLKGVRRRRRRRKKLSTTDPRHPKPNRSGYNFFFQDQHRILKPQYPAQDRLISKMIGERWNNLSPEDKAERKIVLLAVGIHFILRGGGGGGGTGGWVQRERGGGGGGGGDGYLRKSKSAYLIGKSYSFQIIREKHFHLLTGDNYLCYNRKKTKTKEKQVKVRKTKNEHYTSKIADMFKQQGRREENNWTVIIIVYIGLDNKTVAIFAKAYSDKIIKYSDQITIIR
ncbi:hypothetical protein ACJX0J_025478 [Zea mays]